MKKLGLALCLSLVGLAPAHAQQMTGQPAQAGVGGAYNSSTPTCVSGFPCWLQVDVNGQLKVVGTFTPSGSSPEFTPVAPAAATATKGVLAGCQYDSTQKTLTDGQQAAVSCTNRGAFIVATGADALTVQPGNTANTTPWLFTGIPSSASGAALTKSATQSAASNAVVKSGAGNLYGLTVTIGATAGWVMVFDATALPSNGATGASMIWCYPVNSDGTKGGIDKDFGSPIPFTTGLTLGFSSTACNSLTASATAFFYGRVM
jgi:hypothetical protein